MKNLALTYQKISQMIGFTTNYNAMVNKSLHNLYCAL